MVDTKTIEHLEEMSAFILDKCEKLKQNTDVWSVNDLFMLTDIVKDVSEIHKNICKIHKLKSYTQTLV